MGEDRPVFIILTGKPTENRPIQIHTWEYKIRQDLKKKDVNVGIKIIGELLSLWN